MAIPLETLDDDLAHVARALRGVTVSVRRGAGIVWSPDGDILLGRAGRPFASHAELTSLLRTVGPGAVVRFDVGRGGRRVSCEILLDAMVGNAKRAA